MAEFAENYSFYIFMASDYVTQKQPLAHMYIIINYVLYIVNFKIARLYT